MPSVYSAREAHLATFCRDDHIVGAIEPRAIQRVANGVAQILGVHPCFDCCIVSYTYDTVQYAKVHFGGLLLVMPIDLSSQCNPALFDLYLDDVHVATRGARHAAYREVDGQRVMKQSEITVRIDLHREDGPNRAHATVWTCDLSHDYVTINADYRS